jgi:thiosulfate/3-mercaptopyruvate sulfurtransferase
MSILSSVLTVSMLATASNDDPITYARPKLLMEVSELADAAIAKGFRILDARNKTKYGQGHIPGAVWVDHETWSKSFADQQDPKDWAKRIAALGIGDADAVVVYDDNLSKDAARVWWILRYFGVKDARLLNGGWPAWTSAALPVSKHAEVVSAVTFSVRTADTGRLATKSAILDLLKDKKTQIIDARSEKEFCGDEKLKNKRGGAIPGAINLEWTDALDSKTQKFKSPAELTKILKDAGIDVTRPTVTHCQSGGRSSVMVFTLELMGAKDVSNYYRGWSEWGNDESLPIVQPKKK